MAVFDANEHQIDQLPSAASNEGGTSEPVEGGWGEPEEPTPAASDSSPADEQTPPAGEDALNIEALLSPSDEGVSGGDDPWADSESAAEAGSYQLAGEEDNLDELDFDFGGPSEEEEEETTFAPPEELVESEPIFSEQFGEPETPASPFSQQEDDTGEIAAEPEMPEPAAPRKSGGVLALLVWSVLIVALTATLALQYAYYNREVLARQASLRPLLEQLCTFAGCELSPRRDVKAIELAERRVQSHPRFQGALLISATLVNKAHFRQPYPMVEVRLENVRGDPVAARRFQPDEYLAEPGRAGFGPGEEAHLVLEVADPGNDAVSFQFSFL